MNDTLFGNLWTPGTAEFLWNLLIAATVGIVIVLIARQIAKFAAGIGMRVSGSLSIANLARTLVNLVGVLLALYVVLRMLNLDATAYSVLAGAGVMSLIIGFALKDIAANFLSGIILVITRPFKVGHLIETNDTYGIVRKIRLRSTQIESLDGKMVHIPNQSILLQKVSDHSYIPFRRVDVCLSVNYDCDLEAAKKVAHEAVGSLEQRDKNQPIEVYFTEYAEGSISIEARFWVAFSKEQHYLEAKSQGIIAVQKAFKRENIAISYPTVAVKN